MQVHECMMANPITISPKATCAQATRLLRVKKLHALPVVDKEGQLVGIVTEKDLLYIDLPPVPVLGMRTISDFMSAITVEDAMTRRVITVQEDCPLEAAAGIMIDSKIGSLPVMRGDHLVGVITKSDIFRAMADALGGRSEGLRLTVRLLEDRGELGAITDGIIQLGGKLISLCTYWGDNPFNRMITLKVQGVGREDVLMLLEWTIGVQVIDCYESSAESQPGLTSPVMKTEAGPVQDLNAKPLWLRDLK
jgi:acetoin utilization protein AcuB